eukprot:m.418750 g.418750  ORF g.418750 m.418750 type:complete len:112 (-) comp21294_c1_seq2:21-356(-)
MQAHWTNVVHPTLYVRVFFYVYVLVCVCVCVWECVMFTSLTNMSELFGHRVCVRVCLCVHFGFVVVGLGGVLREAVGAFLWHIRSGSCVATTSSPGGLDANTMVSFMDAAD